MAVVLVAMLSMTAHAHFIGWDHVDSGKKIHYRDATNWNDSLNHAIGAWNALGRVRIEPDTVFTIQGTVVYDYTHPSDGYCGVANSSGEIWLNNHYYNGAPTAGRRACTPMSSDMP